MPLVHVRTGAVDVDRASHAPRPGHDLETLLQCLVSIFTMPETSIASGWRHINTVLGVGVEHPANRNRLTLGLGTNTASLAMTNWQENKFTRQGSPEGWSTRMCDMKSSTSKIITAGRFRW
jgi:hypothetical protein